MSIYATRVGRLDKPEGWCCARCGIDIGEPRRGSLRPRCRACYVIERMEQRGVLTA